MGRKKPTSRAETGTVSEKSVVTAEDEQDLNEILSESDAIQEEKDAEKESATSSSKKKKKKKKEKEMNSSVPAVEETKSEISSKKVPKHVREILERQANRREAEERKKREEEERLRKEEEELRKLEELERLAEEKKRLKKEREKEKRLHKKQQGLLLTARQKEEARRSEAFKKHIQADAKLMDSSTGTSSSKRPHNKKSKPQNQSNVGLESELDSIEPDKPQVGVDDHEQDEEEDEEWDAKSWDDTGLELHGESVFADEEVEPLPKKDIPTLKLENLDVSKSKKEAVVNEEESKHDDDHPVNNQNEQSLRSPICCIMGHVDSGKTKLLDCIRGTNVQEGEARGITQQIGATYFPAENICDRTKKLRADAKLNVPGLLAIDTPGHESFTNLRSRGSGLCDIAVLVVDIMHGLEPQTIESLNLLKMRNTDFIVALNKVDRLHGWKSTCVTPIGKEIKKQSKDLMDEFNMRLTQIITQFKEQGINTELYYKNKDMGETYNIVPTSAISGEGIPDLLLVLVQWTQKTMVKRLTYSEEVQCTVLEVKVVEGHGTTIDVVLVNGVLHEGDQIVVCGMQGPIVTTIRALLTPHPMRELRVKGTYLHHKEIKAAQGIKILAHGLEHTIAGTSIYIVRPHDNIEEIKEAAMVDVNSVMSRVSKSGEGVYVQASTLGSLEALLEFLKTPEVNIPVSAIRIGPVHKKDVMKACVMLQKKREYGTILAFDVKVTPEARELADELGVKIFSADIIYHLFDQFKAYIDNLKEEKKREAAKEAVFPCLLRIIPNCVFNKRDPIVLGVQVIAGIAKVGTPICIPQKEFIDIGRIASIENNHRPVGYAKKGQEVAIKIIGCNSEEQQKMFGKHFEIEDELVSKISRRSVDALQEYYVGDLSTEETNLLSKLKKLFKIW